MTRYIFEPSEDGDWIIVQSERYPYGKIFLTSADPSFYEERFTLIEQEYEPKEVTHG